ncbi:MAG: aldehyde dehydrogenase family protein [Shinella sp.]|nr:aldehyde dehydrogenase family protein [Shinella sp.]
MDGGYSTKGPAGNFIGGAWQSEPETMPAINPATGEIIAQLPKSSRETVAKAVAAAKTAASGWAGTPVFQRAEMCVAIASAIDASREKIARLLSAEQGKVLAEAIGEVAKAADGFRLAAELVKQLGGQTLPAEDPTKLVMTIRQPRGVYGVITPWNFPVNIPVEYLAPGIATGNTIVWVPAPSTSLVACALMEAIESAGLPAGVINLVIGEGATAGDAVVVHPDVAAIGFTGSAATGRRIAERGAGKPLLLELGGNGPVVVFEDADLDAAAAAAAGGAFFNAGQVCAATGRVLAHHSIVDTLCEKLAAHAEKHVLGDPFHQGTTMGPLNNAKVAAKVKEHVDDAVGGGARVLHGGKPRPDLGSDLFFEPTVIAGVTRDMKINREETFGPVVPVLSFKDEAEALELALDSEYGLSVGVFTKDVTRGVEIAKAIPAGIVNINAGSTWWEIHLPFGGGSGTKSGIGRLGGVHTMEAMTELKMITVTTDRKAGAA